MTEQGGIGQKDETVETGGYTFRLEDSEGNLHDYRVGKKHEPIPRSNGPSGLRLINYVARVAGQPIAELLETNAGKLMNKVTKVTREGSQIDPEEVRETIQDDEDMDDFNLQLTEALERLTRAFDELDVERVMQDLFYFTTRDGENLRQEAHFNSAYAGNYMEMMKAAYEICQYNGFFGSLGGATEKAENE